MAQPVTDPELLRRLNTPDAAPVADPGVLAKLNDGDPAPAADPMSMPVEPFAIPTGPVTESDRDAVKSALTGAARGAITALPGAVGDLSHLAELGAGKLMSAVGVGAGDDVQDYARKGLRGEGGFTASTASWNNLL